MSSNTSTTPAAPPTSLGNAVHAHISTCFPDSDSSSICSRQSEIRRLQPLLDGGQELTEQGAVADRFVEWLADGRLEIDAEDGAGRLIRGAYCQIGLERHHASGQARENHAKSRALGFDRLLAAARLFARPAQALGHVVEGGHQESQLVAAGQRQRVS